MVDQAGQVIAETLVGMEPVTTGPSRRGVRAHGTEQYGAFTFEVLTDLEAQTGSYTVRGCDLAGEPPHPLLPGLRLLREFRHPHGLRIAGPFGPATHRPDPIPESISADPDTGVVFDFVEALAVIQDHTTAQLRVPDLAKLTRHDIRGILRLAELMRGAAISVPWEGFAVHLCPGTTPPAEGLFSTLLYQQLTITFNGVQASVGYQQVYLPAARVEPGSLTPHGDHQDIRIVSGGGAGSRYQVRTEPTAPARRSR